MKAKNRDAITELIGQRKRNELEDWLAGVHIPFFVIVMGQPCKSQSTVPPNE